MKLTVDPAADRQRLDRFLAAQFPSVSRSFLQSLCKHDKVLVNGTSEKSGYKLRWGDHITVLHNMDQLGEPEVIDIPIIYEDSDVIVVNKPAGVLSHALSKFKNEPSVASFLRQHAQLSSSKNDVRYGIVHRLDRLTSGVMVCAKSDQASKQLQRQFADRTVHKTYLALVSNRPKHDTAVIDVPLERNPKAPATFRVGSRGKPAQTAYKLMGSSNEVDGAHVLEVHPKTGRTHQIRVHLKHVGCPIIGDTLYGGAPADRLYLHAYALALRLPSDSAKERQFTADPPTEFRADMSGVNDE